MRRLFMRRSVMLLAFLFVFGVVKSIYGAETMDPITLQGMNPSKFEAWAKKSIGPYESTLLDAARKHKLPPRLLATVILNELGDYDRMDQAQEMIPNNGSVGIAQITIPTAISNKLVDFSEDEIQKEIRDRLGDWANSNDPGSATEPDIQSVGPSEVTDTPSFDPDPAETRKEAIEYLTWKKLNDPKIAIEAAARQIRWIFSRVNANLGKSWTKTYLKGPINLDDPYANIVTDRPWQRDPKEKQIDLERMMAKLIAGGYNSSKLIWTEVDLSNPGYYVDARKHAVNAAELIADPLAKLGWYGSIATADGPDDQVGANPLNPSATRSLVLLLDASGSMNAKMGDGRSRFDNVKATALKRVQQMDGKLEIALIVFYDCARIVVEVPFTLDSTPLKAKLLGDALRPSGSTPLAAGILKARAYMREYAGSTKHEIITLTDGNETCGGDVVSAIKGKGASI